MLVIIFFYSSSSFSTSIRVLDFQKIIENNKNISLLYDLINKDQLIHQEKFKKEELDLQKKEGLIVMFYFCLLLLFLVQ